MYFLYKEGLSPFNFFIIMSYKNIYYYFGLNCHIQILNYLSNNKIENQVNFIKIAYRYFYRNALYRCYSREILLKGTACYYKLMKAYGEDTRSSSAESIRILVKK